MIKILKEEKKIRIYKKYGICTEVYEGNGTS
jgi:hypothetical protein